MQSQNSKWRSVNYQGTIKFLNTETNEILDEIPLSVEELKIKIFELEDKLKQQNEMSNWVPLENSVNLTKGRSGEMFKTLDIYNYSIPEIIPINAKAILLNTFFMNGAEGPSEVKIRVWTIKNNLRYYYYIKAYRYNANAVAYDSQNLWLPIDTDNRKLYVQTDHVQLTNCHGLDLEIIGYKI